MEDRQIGEAAARLVITGVRRRGDNARLVGMKATKCGNNLSQKVDFADADAVEPDGMATTEADALSQIIWRSDRADNGQCVLRDRSATVIGWLRRGDRARRAANAWESFP